VLFFSICADLAEEWIQFTHIRVQNLECSSSVCTLYIQLDCVGEELKPWTKWGHMICPILRVF